MLSSEQGIYVAETIGAKHTKLETVLILLYSMFCVLYLIHRSTSSKLDLVYLLVTCCRFLIIL